MVKEKKVSLALNTFHQELASAYAGGESLMVVNPSGQQILNPSIEDLKNWSPELFTQNRVRVTLTGRSDNDLCSTELVIMDESGRLQGNYTVNSCSSYGWIFFTESTCFDLALFHDAGLEAPFGSAINGSVDWSFQFNNKNRITGTYRDMGAANMFKVASPCYNDSKNAEPVSAIAARNRAQRWASPKGY